LINIELNNLIFDLFPKIDKLINSVYYRANDYQIIQSFELSKVTELVNNEIFRKYKENDMIKVQLVANRINELPILIIKTSELNKLIH